MCHFRKNILTEKLLKHYRNYDTTDTSVFAVHKNNIMRSYILGPQFYRIELPCSAGPAEHMGALGICPHLLLADALLNPILISGGT